METMEILIHSWAHFKTVDLFYSDFKLGEIQNKVLRFSDYNIHSQYVRFLGNFPNSYK